MEKDNLTENEEIMDNKDKMETNKPLFQIESYKEEPTEEITEQPPLEVTDIDTIEEEIKDPSELLHDDPFKKVHKFTLSQLDDPRLEAFFQGLYEAYNPLRDYPFLNAIMKPTLIKGDAVALRRFFEHGRHLLAVNTIFVSDMQVIVGYLDFPEHPEIHSLIGKAHSEYNDIFHKPIKLTDKKPDSIKEISVHLGETIRKHLSGF
jgi:hypothetical protein